MASKVPSRATPGHWFPHCWSRGARHPRDRRPDSHRERDGARARMVRVLRPSRASHLSRCGGGFRWGCRVAFGGPSIDDWGTVSETTSSKADRMWNVAFTMARRQRRQAAGTGDPPSEGLVGFGQSQLGRITARKVPKTVSPRVVRILAVDHALFLLSSGYLLEWYWVHRPLPNWVLFAAAGAFVLSIALGVALRTVRSSRREL